MATATATLPCKKSVMIFPDLPDYSQVSEEYAIFESEDVSRALILGFASLPSALRFNRLYGAFLKIYAYTYNYALPIILIGSAPETVSDFSPDQTTWNSLNGLTGWRKIGFTYMSSRKTWLWTTVPDNYLYSFGGDAKDAVIPLITRPCVIETDNNDSFRVSVAAANPPELIVEYDDEVLVATQIYANSKTSGYINVHIPQIFEWHYEENDPDGYHMLGPIEQASAVFYWKAATDSEWNTIEINSDALSVTVAADTFPTGSIQWKIVGTDAAGQTSETPTYSLTTADSLMVTTPIQPVSQVISNAEPILFRWSAYNTHATTPTASELQYSTDGASWHALTEVGAGVTSTLIPVQTFSPGTIYWRVRAYNVDNVAGQWSDTAAFIYMAAPDAPAVAATDAPFTTISWQSTGQQAYRISIDGDLIGSFFGRDSSYQIEEPLSDGTHVAAVMIQNSFGLWSPSGETTFTVTNVPGDPVTLTAAFDVDASLSWITEDTEQAFRIYRDGVQIGRTSGYSFIDRFVLGSHSYYVLNLLPGGYYTRSNSLHGAMRSCINRIALASGGPWLEMKLSENSASVQNFSFTRTNSLRHISGAEFPVLEQSNFKTLVGSYDVAFADLEDAKVFEQMRGQVVILKSRGGNVIIGAMTQLNATYGEFYIAYSFQLEQIFWEDFVDDTDP